MVLATLKMIKAKVCQLAASYPATQQNSDDRTVSLALKRFNVGKLPECASLICRKPVSESHTELLQSLHAADASGKFRA
jgi:hypothetical protein